MIDLDTSVVVALLTPEERSPLALDWFGQCRDSLISSDWLITETHSALGLKQRHHGLSPQARQAAGEQFERLFQGGSAWPATSSGITPALTASPCSPAICIFNPLEKRIEEPAVGIRLLQVAEMGASLKHNPF